MSYLTKVWQYALGSYSDDKTKPYDIGMLIVRSAWVDKIFELEQQFAEEYWSQ